MRLKQVVFTWKAFTRINKYNPDADSDLEGTQFEGGEIAVKDEKGEKGDSDGSGIESESEDLEKQ